MKLTKKEKQILGKLVRQIREKFSAKQILLYGSAARGEMDAESDIDIFVVLPEVNWEIEKQVMEMCFDAEMNNDIDRIISTACCTEEELAGRLEYSPFVLNVKREGKPL